MALERNRELWALVNERFTDGDADRRWSSSGIRWGLFQHREDDLDLLGDVAGLDVVEIGCGSAYLSAALARAGARPVAVDLSPPTAGHEPDRLGSGEEWSTIRAMEI